MSRKRKKKPEQPQPAKKRTPASRAEPLPPAQWPGWREFATAGALVLLVLLAYLPALHAGFIWHDDAYVTNNPLLTAPDGLGRIWFSLHKQPQYFPLVYTTFRSEHALWGLNPVGYHLVNILLHGLNAALVWILLRRLAIPGAWLAAAIFALHPVQVESVAWVTELKNVESMLFYLLALLAWLRFVKDDKSPPWKSYWLMLLCCMLALFAKTTACTLPAAMVLVLWLQRKPIGRERMLQIAPVLAMGIGMGLVSVWWEKHLDNYDPALGLSFTFVDRLLMASRAVWFYALKLLWPANLMFSYPRWEIDPHAPVQWVWLAGCIGVAALLWRERKEWNRGVIASVIFFVAALSPLLGFIINYTFRYSFVADHYQYPAVIGLAALFAALAVKGAMTLHLPTPLKMGAASLLLAVLGILTWRQTLVYRDARAVWEDTIAKNPKSWIAHNNLGLCLYAAGEHAQAMEHYRKAIALNPAAANAYNDLATALEHDGKFVEAAEYYARAIELEPHSAVLHYNLGMMKVGRSDPNGAIAEFQRSLVLQPRMGKAHAAWGMALMRQKQQDEAIRHYELAAELDPISAEVHFELGNALLSAGKVDEALKSFWRSQSLNPRSTATLVNTGRALLIKGRTAEAVSAFRAALAIDEACLPALNNLGGALVRQGKLSEAADCFQKAVQADPADPELHYNYGQLLLKQGNRDEARKQFAEAVRLKPDFTNARQQLQLLETGGDAKLLIR